MGEFFEPGGPLAGVVGGRYRYRPEQVELAAKVKKACGQGGMVVLADAPTGTGKSLAYLAPVALLDPREAVVVSTSGKALQRQLIGKDLPALAEAMVEDGHEPPSYALLKGRGNFLCPRRFEELKSSRSTILARPSTIHLMHSPSGRTRLGPAMSRSFRSRRRSGGPTSHPTETTVPASFVPTASTSRTATTRSRPISWWSTIICWSRTLRATKPYSSSPTST